MGSRWGGILGIQTHAAVLLASMGIAGCCFKPAREAENGPGDAAPADAGHLDAGADAGFSDAGFVDAGTDAGGDAGIRLCLGPPGLPISSAPSFGLAFPVLGNPGFSPEIVTGDVNGDGLSDLLQADGVLGSFLGIYFGLPDGGLSPPTLLDPSYFALPLDPDGGAAVVSLNVYYWAQYVDGGGPIEVFANDGQLLGMYSAGIDPKYGAPDDPNQVAVADLNGDGKPDLVTCENDQLEALLNLGAEHFGPPQVIASLSCFAIAAGDLNGDGVSDLVARGYGTNEITVLIADRDGGFTSTVYPTVPIGSIDQRDGYSVVLQDLNGDGLPDISTVELPGFYVWLNQGDGKFAAGVAYSIGVESAWPSYLTLADFNGDCWPDALVSTGAGFGCSDSTAMYAVYLFLNRGDGTFSGPITVDTGLPRPFGIAAYKGAGAGLPSIAVADRCSGQFEMLPNITQP